MNKYYPPISRRLDNYANATTMIYKSLHLFGASENKQINVNFTGSQFSAPNILKFTAKDKEEMLDFLCGNKWPKFMEEFIQSIVQDLTCFN